MSIDEFEVLRLSDLGRLKHEDASGKMRISRPTFSRILSSAHKKIADALVNIKALKIEGGCCKVIRKRSCAERRIN